MLHVENVYLLWHIQKIQAQVRGGQNLSRRLNAQDRVAPRTKIFWSVYFPRDLFFGRITYVTRDVTVVL